MLVVVLYVNEIQYLYTYERTRIIQYIMILWVITRGDYGHVTWLEHAAAAAAVVAAASSVA